MHSLYSMSACNFPSLSLSNSRPLLVLKPFEDENCETSVFFRNRASERMNYVIRAFEVPPGDSILAEIKDDNQLAPGEEHCLRLLLRAVEPYNTLTYSVSRVLRFAIVSFPVGSTEAEGEIHDVMLKVVSDPGAGTNFYVFLLVN